MDQMTKHMAEKEAQPITSQLNGLSEEALDFIVQIVLSIQTRRNRV